jgi:DNA-binding NarL/FixJ family response regulator
MAEAIRVLLADDHPLVRAGIRSVLTTEKDIVLVGEAVDGDQVQRLCQELEPEVLLLDLNMPGPSPFATVAYLRQHCPAVKVLVLTAYDDDAYVRGLTTAGVAGYVLKDEVPETVVRAIRVVVDGDTWLSRPVVEKLAQWETEASPLSEREQQILALMTQGWDNIGIATELNLAEQTVRNYVSRIYARLGVESRVEAVVWARKHGLA